MKRIVLILFILPLSISLKAQVGLSSLDITGFTRGAIYAGLTDNQDPALRSAYSETGLRLKARAGRSGFAYTELRFRTGSEYDHRFMDLDVREAYADLSVGWLDLRIGKQINPWGRADGLNPTDHLTPKNYFVRSSDPDDMRMGAWMLRTRLTPWQFLRLEADLVPFLEPSVYRFDLIEIPDFVRISPLSSPRFKWENIGMAFKADLIFSAAEGSISWFRGYDPLPLLFPGIMPAPPFTDFQINLHPTPFRQESVGADLATLIGKTGLRAEAAWKRPLEDDSLATQFAAEEIQWTLSADRELGPVRLIIAWNGKFIPDFLPLDPPGPIDLTILQDPSLWPVLGPIMNGQIGYFNRILLDQTHEWSHNILIRPSLTLFHETLEIGLSGLWNWTTEEYLVYPQITWKPSDGAEVRLGYQYYHGEPNTRFNWIGTVFNGPWCEIRISF